MSITNFDQSSTGVNLSLNCFYDTFMSQENFNEKLIRLDSGEWLFTGYDWNGNNWEKSYNVNCDIKELFKKYASDYYGKHYSLLGYEDVRDLLQEVNSYWDILPLKDCTLECMLKALEEHHCYTDDSFNDFLEEHFETSYFVIETRGYCQGDQEQVILCKEMFDHYGFDFTEDVANSFKEEIDNLFWDSPVYCELQVNDIEVMPELEDWYKWDRQEVLKNIMDNLHLYVTLNKKEENIVSTFLTDNLPEYPEHK